MKITGDLFNAYISCRYKAHLLPRGEAGTLSDYKVFKLEFQDKLKISAEAALVDRFGPSSTSRKNYLKFADLKDGCPLFLATVVQDEQYAFSYYGLRLTIGAVVVRICIS